MKNSDLLKRLKNLSAASLSDSLRGMHTLDSGIRCLTPGKKLTGRAFTVLAEAGSIITVHKALLEAKPGDVLVIGGETGRDLNAALFGKLMTCQALQAGIAGAVVDGAARDLAEIRELAFPLFARAGAPRVGVNRRVGCVQVPIPCGGLVIHPGDYILGDEDGVAVIPAAEIENTLDAAEARLRKESEYLARIENGEHITDLIGFTELIYPEKNHDQTHHPSCR